MVRRKLGSIALAAALLTGAAACGDDGASTGASGALGSLSAALEEVPAIEVEQGTVISWADLDAASEALGLDRPQDAADREEVHDWLMALNAEVEGAVLVPLPSLLTGGGADPAGFEEELGWSILDLERYLEVASPPTTFFLATGDVDVDGEGVDPLDDGLHTAGAGDDHQVDLEGRTRARPTGVPLRLALEDGVIAVSTVTGLVTAWRDGDDGSLLDEERFAAVAGALDDAGAISAMVFPNREVGVAWDADAAGIGWWVDDGEPRATLVFHLLDPDDADAAARALEEELRDGTTMRGVPFSELHEVVEVTADDGLVVATVTPTRRQALLQQLMTGDTPFAPSASGS